MGSSSNTSSREQDVVMHPRKKKRDATCVVSWPVRRSFANHLSSSGSGEEVVLRRSPTDTQRDHDQQNQTKVRTGGCVRYTVQSCGRGAKRPSRVSIFIRYSVTSPRRVQTEDGVRPTRTIDGRNPRHTASKNWTHKLSITSASSANFSIK